MSATTTTTASAPALKSLAEILDTVPDYRKAQGRIYSLKSILLLAALAMLCGFRSYSAIAQFGRLHNNLAPLLGFDRPVRPKPSKPNSSKKPPVSSPSALLAAAEKALDGEVLWRTPCVSEIHTVFSKLDPVRFEQILANWAQTHAHHLNFPELSQIAIDGKRLRGSRCGEVPGIHILSAYSVEDQSVLAQVLMPADTNEHKAALQLLKLLPQCQNQPSQPGLSLQPEPPSQSGLPQLESLPQPEPPQSEPTPQSQVLPELACQLDQMTEKIPESKPIMAQKIVVSGDAIFTQHEVCQAVVDSGHDYFFVVKENQKDLCETIKLTFQTAETAEERRRRQQIDDFAETINKGHGRIEIRRLRSTTRLEGYLNWPEAKQVCVIERTRKFPGKEPTREITFVLTSLDKTEASATRLLEIARNHWHIENKNHYVRDETLGEDKCRVRNPSGARILSGMRSAVLGILKQSRMENSAAALRRLSAKPKIGLDLINNIKK